MIGGVGGGAALEALRNRVESAQSEQSAGGRQAAEAMAQMATAPLQVAGGIAQTLMKVVGSISG